MQQRATNLLQLAAEALSGRYLPHGATGSADCIVALSFGFRGAGDGVASPGLANTYLAELVASRFASLPVVAQSEIADALETGKTSKRVELVVRQEPGEGYLDTHAVLSRSVRLMHDAGWTSPILIAHPYHLPRADATFRALGVDPIVPAGIDAIWDSASRQPWTRNRIVWGLREMPVLCLYALKGWLELSQHGSSPS